MKKYASLLVFIFFGLTTTVQWSLAGDKIKTDWAKKIDPTNVWPEYPRPIMERKEWKNLNGLWDYSILKKGSAEPATFQGKLLVPFAVESSLSGVMKTVGDENEVWYHTEFTIPENWQTNDILLHFGAVDWKTEVWLNDIKIGEHTGGYTPFSFNLTPFLQNRNKLVVKVWDPTSDGPQPRGKQVNDPKGIWYTPVTGIWQTVWLEPVPKTHIENMITVPDIDLEQVTVTPLISNAQEGDWVQVAAWDGSTQVAMGKAVAGQSVTLSMPDTKLWSPESPFLYDLKITVHSNGAQVDEVSSYFAMRKVDIARDDNGVMRLRLNNRPYFQYGTLDQGWWPDGLYTAPSDEALKYDIEKTKAFGFNMIRKHVKVEPARWYAHCDRIGMLVWQDMPSGDRTLRWDMRHYYEGSELHRSPESEAIYRKEWKDIMDFLISQPSIVVWVPFNEAWGQFKTEEIAEWTKSYDPSRLVNPASGGNFFHTGDILDLHNYPEPKLYLVDGSVATVLGEYGGIGLPLKGHLWKPDNNWGYVKFNNSKEVTDEYVKYAQMLKKLVPSGFSGAIYTQTTDVEGEVNGLMTYDRKVDKLDVSRVKKANQEVIQSLH